MNFLAASLTVPPPLVAPSLFAALAPNKLKPATPIAFFALALPSTNLFNTGLLNFTFDRPVGSNPPSVDNFLKNPAMLQNFLVQRTASDCPACNINSLVRRWQKLNF